MDSERFGLLVNVLKILKNQKSTTDIQGLVEIVDTYDEELTIDQRAVILREVLRFAKKDTRINERMSEADQNERFRNSMNDYFF
ncbi:MAG: hypothetical protein V1870_03370 [Candidatus Aenigmatarchaeota archaeon]